MVKSGQAERPRAEGEPQEIRSVSFTSPLHPQLPVEVVDRNEVITRVGPQFLARPDRPSFTTLMLVHSGAGRHVIDFEQVALQPGRLIRVQPQQVQSWDLTGTVSMTMVLSAATGSARPTWTPSADPSRNLGRQSLATAVALIEVLRTEQARFDGDDHSVRVMVRIFEALDALYDRAQAQESTPGLPQAWIAFRAAIETSLGEGHSIRDYAQQLGYSERTISRACQRVTGLTAKGVLTQRLVLEAKRLLAHTDLAAATIGHQLGFSEATNFHKFFLRNVGQRPSQFRASERATSAT